MLLTATRWLGSLKKRGPIRSAGAGRLLRFRALSSIVLHNQRHISQHVSRPGSPGGVEPILASLGWRRGTCLKKGSGPKRHVRGFFLKYSRATQPHWWCQNFTLKYDFFLTHLHKNVVKIRPCVSGLHPELEIDWDQIETNNYDQPLVKHTV